MEGSSSNRTVNSESSDDEELYDIMPADFEWTAYRDRKFWEHVKDTQPFGMNKYMNMMVLRNKLSKEFKLTIPNEYLWARLRAKINLKVIDNLTPLQLDVSHKPLSLSAEYDKFIKDVADDEEEKKLADDCIMTEILSKQKIKDFFKKKKTSKSSSMSAGDSKDGTAVQPLMPSESSSFKTVDIRTEEITPITSRRSLRTNEKPEEKEVDDTSNKIKLLRSNTNDDFNKSSDLKMLGKKSLNQSKDLENNEKVGIKRGRKKKSRNVSESSFSSDNSKQLRSHKNSLTDITVSESSSRSVTPEILRGKASNRSITPETPSRKSNLRSSDKDQKIKQGLEKASTKHGHVDLGLPELKIERIKPESSEKQYANSTDSKLKPRHSTPNKTETNANKSRTRNRVSSDILVAQQSEFLPLGRRSCNNKN